MTKMISNYDFDSINEFVHDTDVTFEDMQGLCIELVIYNQEVIYSRDAEIKN